jgi:hypothetical protein
MNEPKSCRNCKWWQTTKPFMGNCWVHPWKHDKYSETAAPAVMGCRDYTEKQIAMPIAKER